VTPGGAPLKAVSCMSATSCMAATDEMAFHWDGGQWRRESLVTAMGAIDDGEYRAYPTIMDISCPAPDRCVALSQVTWLNVWIGAGKDPLRKALYWDGTTWTGTPVPARYDAVSCASATRCLAAGERTGASAVFDGTTWKAAAISPDGFTINGVSCYASGCMAGGRRGTWATTATYAF
jgi:hypothetical protein